MFGSFDNSGTIDYGLNLNWFGGALSTDDQPVTASALLSKLREHSVIHRQEAQGKAVDGPKEKRC